MVCSKHNQQTTPASCSFLRFDTTMKVEKYEVWLRQPKCTQNADHVSFPVRCCQIFYEKKEKKKKRYVGVRNKEGVFRQRGEKS